MIYLLTDRFGNEIAEIQDSDSRQTSLRLSRVTTGQFTLQTTNDLMPYVRGVDQALVQVYRNNLLIGHGPLTPNYSKTVSDQAKSIQVNWSGVGWRLGRRIIEASKSPSGLSYGSPVSPPSGYIDRGVMCSSIINGLNVAPVPAPYDPKLADTGIRMGSVPTTSSTAVGPWYYKNALQAVSELAATTDPFEWNLRPTLPVADGTGLQIAAFDCATAFGSTLTDVMFEYGDGKENVASFTETGDFTGAMNRAYNLPTSFPDAVNDPNTPGSAVLTYEDWMAIQSRGFIYEDVIQNDLVVDDMRNKLNQNAVLVQKLPKTVVTFTPVVSSDPDVVPEFGVDYNLGDLVRFRAVEHDVETINGYFRIYGVTFTEDANGAETVNPILLSTDS